MKGKLSKKLRHCMILMTIILIPSSVMAASYPMTAFIPELATPTIELQYLYHSDEIDDYDLDRSAIGLRLDYVIYPSVELLFSLDYLSYTLESREENGVSFGAGLKYQLPALVESLDMAVAAVTNFGQAGDIDEYDLSLLYLVSQDIPQGWTPFGGIGYSIESQEFTGDAGLPSVKESDGKIVAFIGLKFLFQNHIGGTAAVFQKGGLGTTFSLSYRF